MNIAATLIDFVLHVDVHLRDFVLVHGAWVYALLFAIIFVETGLVVMPFLPGDSLLFVVGALCGLGLMNLPLSMALLTAAAVAGNQTNYAIGRRVGPRVFQWEQSRWFNRKAFDRMHAFYERHGGITIVLARFMPFLRTFAPFVAGVAQMTRRTFTVYDVTGGALWVCGLTLTGYLFGNLPWVQANLSKIIWAMILVPGIFVLIGAWRSRGKNPDGPERQAAGLRLPQRPALRAASAPAHGQAAITCATAAVSFLPYGTCRNSLGPWALLFGPSTPQTIICAAGNPCCSRLINGIVPPWPM